MVGSCQQEKQSEVLKNIKRTSVPNIFIEGRVFDAYNHAAEELGLYRGTVRFRCLKSDSHEWWFPLHFHSDPIHDELEAVVAILQFAKANPNHENVPQWAHDYLDGLNPEWREHRTPGRHGAAPAWAA